MINATKKIETLASCGSHEDKSTKVDPIKVSVYEVSRLAQKQELKYSDTIEPDNTVQIGFAVPGVVNNVAVQEGQFVQKIGSVLEQLLVRTYWKRRRSGNKHTTIQ